MYDDSSVRWVPEVDCRNDPNQVCYRILNGFLGIKGKEDVMSLENIMVSL